MCGIAGLMAICGQLGRDPASAALTMADAVPHRGPDGRDAWGDPDAGIGLGHRRLSIVDLSPTGAQPMHSADGRYVITFNGEVYNFPELRIELAGRGHKFRGTSDTEVMLAAFVEWGPERAVQRFVGMFAFALFDRHTRMLRLVRDRFGVKPLYWTIADGILLFGSELRALMAHPSFRREVNRDAIAAVVRYGYVPAPATVFHNVHKLPAGTILTAQPGGQPAIKPYWRFSDVLARRGTNPLSFTDAAARVDELLRQAVRRRMIADVPLGAFLSGGTDSSAVVAVMQQVSNRPARTFTIGFEQAAYDEAGYAREVARHLGTDHTEVTLEPGSALDLVSNVADWFDEPFADSSQLPTYLVSRTTRRHVTVALSGDGGDETFAGYPKYPWLDGVWSGIGWWPRPLRAAFGQSIAGLPEPLLQRCVGAVLEPGRAERIGEKARRLAAALRAPDSGQASAAIAAIGIDDDALVPGATNHLYPFELDTGASLPDLVSRMQAQDTVGYLPDDILTKVDRCSMAVSLEAREPLLDHELVEFVWSLPASVHRGGDGPKGSCAPCLRAICRNR